MPTLSVDFGKSFRHHATSIRRHRNSKGQALLEYVLLVGFFVLVVIALMSLDSVLAKGFKKITQSVVRMGP